MYSAPHFITVTDAADNEHLLPIHTINDVVEATNASYTATVLFNNGRQPLNLNETHTAVYALLEAVRDEYNAALAGNLTRRRVAVADANYTILAADSGKPHIVANVSADRTFTLPAEEDGLDFEFIADVVAADGHDWIIDSGSDTNFFTGGVIHIDQDAAGTGVEAIAILPDGNSNSKLQINLPNGGTRLRLICNGTTWTVSGVVVSTTAPAFADQ